MRFFQGFLCCSLSFLLCGLSQAQSGQFQQLTTFSTGSSPSSVALVDLNLDGKLDIVTANQASNNVSALLGKGDGTFRTAQNFDVGQGPDSLAVGDFNHDGKADVVVANHDSNSISILLGNGNGSFQPAANIGLDLTPTFVVSGDFNNDGSLDVAVLGGGELSVLLGKGDGTFQNALTSSFTGTVLAAGDFNGDGRLDLASAGIKSIFLALGNGNGTFKQQTQVVRFSNTVGPLLSTDTNRDGKLDLVAGTSKGIAVLLGRGNGKFGSPSMFGRDASSGGIAAGDLNGDGKPDLVVGTGDLSIFIGRGNGTFRIPKDYMEQGNHFIPVIGDLNHDNKLDVVTGQTAGSSVAVYLGKGDGNLRSPRNFNNPPGQSVGKLVTSDFDDDGISDLVVYGHFMSGNGDGTFGPPIAIPSLADIELVGDFDGDGERDLITFGTSRSALVVLLGRGDGTFKFVGNFDTGGPPRYATEGDFDGDGIVDIAVVNANNGGNVAVLLGNGDGTFQSPVNYPTTEEFTSFVLAGTFNQDHKLDLLVGSGQDTINLLLGNGDGTFKAPKVIHAAGCFAADPDLDGDNKLDIVLVGCPAAGVNNNVTVLLGNGNGTFQNPVNYAAGVSGLLKVRDVNNDGALDVIVPDTQNSGNTVAVLPGNGDGSLQSPQFYVVDGSITGVTPGADFNFDNFLDLAVGNSNHVSILLNTRRPAR